MSDYSCNILNRSKEGRSGARLHEEQVRKTPVNSKILMFILCTQLLEYYIINSIGSLAMNILIVYKHSVINEV